jgi:hypothetical protein
MRNWSLRGAFSLLGLVLMLAAYGCGSSGGGSGSPVSGIAGSFYAGHWTGTWENDTGWGGTLDFTVDNEGRISGTVFDGYSRKLGRASGRIEPDGKIVANWRYPEEEETTATGASRLEGRDALAATLVGAQGGQSVPPMEVSLLRHYH